MSNGLFVFPFRFIAGEVGGLACSVGASVLTPLGVWGNLMDVKVFIVVLLASSFASALWECTGEDLFQSLREVSSLLLGLEIFKKLKLAATLKGNSSFLVLVEGLFVLLLGVFLDPTSLDDKRRDSFVMAPNSGVVLSKLHGRELNTAS